jgi:hypothetical protein
VAIVVAALARPQTRRCRPRRAHRCLLGLVGRPAWGAFLPDAYRAIAPWLPVAPAADALRSALFFGSAGIAAPLVVVAAWAILGVAVLAARDLVAPARRRAALATA